MLRALTFVLPSLDRTPLTNRLHREVVGVGLEPRRRDGAVHRAEVITLLSRLAVGFAEAVGEADVVDPGFLVALDLGAGRQTEDVLLSSVMRYPSSRTKAIRSAVAQRRARSPAQATAAGRESRLMFAPRSLPACSPAWTAAARKNHPESATWSVLRSRSARQASGVHAAKSVCEQAAPERPRMPAPVERDVKDRCERQDDVRGLMKGGVVKRVLSTCACPNRRRFE